MKQKEQILTDCTSQYCMPFKVSRELQYHKLKYWDHRDVQLTSLERRAWKCMMILSLSGRLISDHNNIQWWVKLSQPHYPIGDLDNIDEIGDDDDDDDNFENADYEPRWQVRTLRARPCRWWSWSSWVHTVLPSRSCRPEKCFMWDSRDNKKR